MTKSRNSTRNLAAEPEQGIAIERTADVNGHPAFVVIIDGTVHLAFRDADEQQDGAS